MFRDFSGIRSETCSSASIVIDPRPTWNREDSHFSHHCVPFGEAEWWFCPCLCTVQYSCWPVDWEDSPHRTQSGASLCQIPWGHWISCFIPCAAQSDTQHGLVSHQFIPPPLEYRSIQNSLLSAFIKCSWFFALFHQSLTLWHRKTTVVNVQCFA